MINSCEECNAFEDLSFFRSYFCLSRDFCQPACSFAAQTTTRNATNLQTFCFNDHDHHYESFFLSRDSLSCAIHSLDLCISFKFIFFLPPDIFTHFPYSNFSYVYYHAEYFSYPWWCRWLAKARNLILILILVVKGLTWTIFYFPTFIVLNFHKI